MNTGLMKRTARQSKVLSELAKVILCLEAGHHLYVATLLTKCTEKVTFAEAEKTADLFKFFYPQQEVSPMKFLQSEDEITNKAIQAYSEYEKRLLTCPFKKRVFESFCHWYAKSNSSGFILNHLYVDYMASIIVNRRLGIIDAIESERQKNQFVQYNKQLFAYHPRMVTKEYFKLRDKLNEIEAKVNTRKPDIEPDYIDCPI